MAFDQLKTSHFVHTFIITFKQKIVKTLFVRYCLIEVAKRSLLFSLTHKKAFVKQRVLSTFMKWGNFFLLKGLVKFDTNASLMPECRNYFPHPSHLIFSCLINLWTYFFTLRPQCISICFSSPDKCQKNQQMPTC